MLEFKIGQRYKVEAEDCCLSVYFEATLSEILYDEDDDQHEYPDLKFDNGVILHGHSLQHNNTWFKETPQCQQI